MKNLYFITLIISCINLFSFTSIGQTRTLDKTLPVGTTAGAFNVSAGGDATYSIPIPVPPGTAGMTPTISVNYSSGSGDGMMGMGWSLGAASAISLVPQNIFNDGQVRGVKFDGKDPLALDGNRLKLIYGSTYGSWIYRTQQETFADIKGLGITGNGPSYFQVQTKDGKILEYGNTIDSKIYSKTYTVITWFLNKVTDANGNYMTYTYHNDPTNGEYWLERIDYTGNSSMGLIPYNSVRFTYSDRANVTTTYLNGLPFKRSKYLQMIQTYNENTIIKQFQFLYDNSDNLKLKEIVEYGKYGYAKYNSTIIDWGVSTSSTTGIYPGIVNSSYYGDFNGNGITEICDGTAKYEQNTSNEFVKLASCSLPNPLENKNVIGDFNGDGKDDVVVGLTNNSSTISLYLSNGIAFSPKINFGGYTGFGIILAQGDFNGDKISDVITSSGGTKTLFWGDAVNPFSSQESISIDLNDSIYAQDFNGDGKSELMVVNSTGSKIFEWQINGFSLIQSDVTPTKYEHIFFGDFNGDGNTDFISGRKGLRSWGSLTYYISTGNGFVKNSFLTSPVSNSIIFTGDIDGNGTSEINVSEFINLRHYYKSYTYKNGSFVARDEFVTYDEEIVGCVDFNGDGLNEYLLNYGEEIGVSYTFENNINNLVTSITNGLNNKIQVTYKPLTDASVYTPKNFTYPLTNYNPPAYVVSKVDYLNGKGGTISDEYLYEGLALQKQRNAIMGFSKITMFNRTKRQKIVNTFEIYPTLYFPYLKKQEVFSFTSDPFSGNTPVGSTTFTTSVKDFGNKQYFAYTSEQSSINNLTGITSSATFGYDNYGNMNYNKTNNGGLITETSNVYISSGAWCMNRIQSTSTTAYKNGEAPISTSGSYEYFPNGLLKWHINMPGNPNQVFTNYTYNLYGNVETVKVSTDGTNGRTVTYEYDPKQRLLVKTTNSKGLFKQNTWDYGLGVITESHDQTNIPTNYNYDSFGRLYEETSAIHYSNTTLSWVSGTTPANACYYSILNTNGNPAIYTWYDVLGRPILSQTKGLDGRNIYVETGFTNKGQVDYVTLPYYEGESNLDRKTYQYDDLGRVTSEIAPGVNLSYKYNGLITEITDNIKGQTYKREADVSGLLSKSTDKGGDVSYVYNAAGQVRQVSTPGSNTLIEYDEFGRQKSLTDPNAGMISYKYNIYNELETQIDQKGTTTLRYDNIGRIEHVEQSTFNTDYTYRTDGTVENVSSTNGTSYGFNFDSYLRPQSKTENIQGSTLTTSYEFGANSRISKVTFSSGYYVTYYYSYGYLSEIKTPDGSTIWKATSMNSKGQIMSALYGNGATRNLRYNSEGNLLRIWTDDGHQNLEYLYNSKGLMGTRMDYIHNTNESFGYDEMNRLNSINGKTILYAPNGNIQYTTENGNYTYDADKKNALVKVDNSSSMVSTLNQTIHYTSFNKVNDITDGSNTATFTYGPDYSRKKLVEQIDGNSITRLYSDGYEYENRNGVVRELHYIEAYGEIVAIFEKKASGDAMYYVYTDHLGSLNVITDANRNVVQDMSFDVWGNRRNPYTLVNYTTPPSNLITSRGFTGHEHMDDFGLINMNGRMYDPKVGRFLSPDPFVGDPTSTQDYNRYSYVLNNPLAFTDPSGNRYMYIEMPVFDENAARWMAYARGDIYLTSLSGGSIFPKMGIAGGPTNSLGWDIQYAQNVADKYGDQSGLEYIRYQLENTSYYSGKGALIGHVVFSGKNMETFRGFNFTDGTSWYTEDGIDKLWAKVDWADLTHSPNGVTVIENSFNKSIIRLDHQATLNFYDYLETRKKTGDLILALSPTPAGPVGKAISIGTKILAIGEYFFGGQPGFDAYIRSGKEQGITLISYTSYNAVGSSTTFQIILNLDKSVLGYKTIMNF